MNITDGMTVAEAQKAMADECIRRGIPLMVNIKITPSGYKPVWSSDRKGWVTSLTEMPVIVTYCYFDATKMISEI